MRLQYPHTLTRSGKIITNVFPSALLIGYPNTAIVKLNRLTLSVSPDDLLCKSIFLFFREICGNLPHFANGTTSGFVNTRGFQILLGGIAKKLVKNLQ